MVTSSYEASTAMKYCCGWPMELVDHKLRCSLCGHYEETHLVAPPDPLD